MAFYGDAETLELLLNTVRGKLAHRDCSESTEQVLSCITQDDNRLTPFYVAAANGHEKMCDKLLDFLKKNLAPDQLRNLSNSENGFLYFALAKAIALRENDMFRLILTTVKQIVGLDYLIVLLKSRNIEGNRIMFAACASNEFEILVDIILAGDSDKNKGYQHLNDMILHDESTIWNLKYVEPPLLKEMLKVYGCEYNTRDLLNVLLDRGLMSIISEHIFKKLDDDQRSQILQAIISTRANEKISYLVKWLDYHNSFFNYRNYETFLKCVLDYTGETAVKKLVLHDSGRVITHTLLLNEDSLFNVSVAYLSPENRDEVGKSVIGNAPQMIKEMYNLYQKNGGKFWVKLHCKWSKLHKRWRNKQRKFLYWLNILNLVVEYADCQQLSELIGVISTVRYFNGKKRTIWSDTFQNDDDLYNAVKNNIEKVGAFLNCVSEKLGHTIVKDLVLQEEGKMITRVLLCYDEHLFNSMLNCLSAESRTASIQQVLGKIPETMEGIFLDPNQKHCLYWMNMIHFIVENANRDQLRNVVNAISTVHYLGGRKCSIWSNFLCDVEAYQNFNEKINNFLKLVADKLGENVVTDLLLHDEGKGITCALLRYDENLINVTWAYLSEENRTKVGKSIIDNAPQLMEELFLDKELESLPSWMNILQFLLNYSNNEQLSKLVDVIVKKPLRRNTVRGRNTLVSKDMPVLSIWGAYLDKCYANMQYFTSTEATVNALAEKVDKFLKCVSEKMGQTAVKNLVIHHDGQCVVIRRIAVRGQKKVLDAMLTHLNDHDRDEIHQLFVTTASYRYQ